VASRLLIAAVLAQAGCRVGYEPRLEDEPDAAAVESFERRIASSEDDAEEEPDGTVRIDDGDLDLGEGSRGAYLVGLRFVDLDIPPGSSIVSATIQFQADSEKTSPSALVLRGQADDDPDPFAAIDGDLSSRERTVAAIGWDPPPWDLVGASGPDQRTPDLAPVLREIVDRPGWASGNAAVVFVYGFGQREGVAFDRLPGAAPLLRVELERPGG
jgi:hypothetical protein